MADRPRWRPKRLDRLTGDPSIDDAPRDVLRWRTFFAEKHMAALLYAAGIAHDEQGCCCPDGRCVLSEEWVPEAVRLVPENEDR